MTIKPTYKVSNSDNGVTIAFDLPGVRKEDIKLAAEANRLKISANRNQVIPENWQLINKSEKPDGYELELNLHADLNTADTQAKFENAVLEITVNKHEAAKPREISILN